MNIDEKLRFASRDIERVTASVTPPPFKEIRRSARIRGIGVAMASAAAVVVLVGGAVVLLNGNGPTTLEPAGPGETVTTTTMPTYDVELLPSESLVIPGPAAMPDVPVDPLDENVVLPIDSAVLADDIALMRSAGYYGPLTGNVEIVAVGQLGNDQDPPRMYVTQGTFADDATEDLRGLHGECQVMVTPAGVGSSCGAPQTLSVTMFSELEDGSTFVVGSAPGDAPLAVFVRGEATAWQLTRDSFFMARVEQSTGGLIAYTYYDANGNVIVSGWDIGDAGSGSETTCSGRDAVAREVFDGVPEDVLATVVSIIDAAQVCDYDLLEAYAGDEFTASFGGGDASELWTMQEERGDKPMYWLVSILSLPHGVIETEQGTMYVWPAAYAHDGSWETTPEADVEALRTLFSDEELQGFADFGGYIGYRVGIGANGDWSFFAAGD